MATISEALAIAVAQQQAGRLDLAEEICRGILAVEPAQADALDLLGGIAYQAGRFAAAEECLRRAIAANASVAEHHNNLGLALGRQGKLGEAIACHQRAVELKPDFAEGRFNLAAAHNNLGLEHHGRAQFEAAVACYRRALELEPDLAEAHFNLANACADLGNRDAAVAAYRRALQCRPDYPEAENNLATVLQDLGEFEEAVACSQRALERRPERAEWHNNLANACANLGKLDEAVAGYQRALELKPDYTEACNNLGNVFRGQGRLDEAIGCYRRALELNPALVQTHSNLLCALQYREGVTVETLARAHAEFEQRHAAPLRSEWRPHARPADATGPLRLGFVSPDLCNHAVSRFLAGVLEGLDRSQCEVVCYSDRIAADEMTARFKAAAGLWRDTFRLSDEQLAERIRCDRIKILFDLAGHTAGNRLLVFARKPAPVQITWLGYEGTTGLTAIDYLIADRHLVPAGAEACYTEKILRLPDGYVCYDPPRAAPPVGPLPAAAAGHATFAAFHSLAKITPAVVAVWSALLTRLPRSRLIIKSRGGDTTGARSRLARLFAAGGIGPERLEFLGASSYWDYLATYNRVDVALDPFPFNGGVTTCDALWMGVPVITCPGETFAGRHSLSHLSTIGLTETIAPNLAEYVDLAVELAQDLPRLSALRAALRQKVSASPLCDGPRLAGNLLHLVRGI